MSKKKIFIVNGAATSGKSTFELMCNDYCFRKCSDKLVIESIINPVKCLVSNITVTDLWDGSKDPKSRKFLSDLKDLVTEYNNYPMRKTIEEVDIMTEYYDSPAAFIDMREAADIDKFKELYGDRYDIQTLIVRRPGDTVAAETSNNHADRDVFEYDYDIHINNNGDLEALQTLAEWFVDSYIYTAEDV